MFITGSIMNEVRLVTEWRVLALIRMMELPVSINRWQHEPQMFYNFCLVNNNNSTTIETNKKISTDLES